MNVDLLFGPRLETTLVDEIVGEIEARNPDPASLEHLTVVEADLLGTVTAVGVIGNGGLDYWYQGKDHQVTEAVARSFGRLGLPEAADALRRSLDAFPDRRMTPAEYAHFCESHRAAATALWRPLNEVFFATDWGRAALTYVVANSAVLTEVVPGAGRVLTKLERAWARAATGLRAALEDAAELDRDGCRRAIAANDHHAAHAQLVAAGPRAGRARRFWAALHEVAELLAVHDQGVSRWNHRFATQGYVAVDVEVSLAGASGARFLASGPARWNPGTRPRRLLGHRAEVHAVTIEEVRGLRLVRDRIQDQGRIRLVPAQAVPAGEPIVIHRDGEVVARGTVVDVVIAEDS
ncbi:MAG TPA: hypothetical protein VM734_29695 [Kofleriaceae bacterium]|nr:hypothetical protein [Kofleriaceae bacterium]